jgi:hypothetical protein
MPRTTYDATFGLIARGLCLMSGFGPDDRKASIHNHSRARCDLEATSYEKGRRPKPTPRLNNHHRISGGSPMVAGILLEAISSRLLAK